MPLVPPWRRRSALGASGWATSSREPSCAAAHRGHLRCGEKRDLRYGEEWACESCGRRWDTNQIPAEQYEAIRRTQLRFRVLPVAYGLGVLALAVFFTLTGNTFSVFILLPLAMMLWFYFVRPFHRRRYRRAVAELPRWELRPE